MLSRVVYYMCSNSLPHCQVVSTESSTRHTRVQAAQLLSTPCHDSACDYQSQTRVRGPCPLVGLAILPVPPGCSGAFPGAFPSLSCVPPVSYPAIVCLPHPGSIVQPVQNPAENRHPHGYQPQVQDDSPGNVFCVFRGHFFFLSFILPPGHG